MIATRLGVGVESATGLLARRRDGLLFTAGTTFAGWLQLIEQFLIAADVEAAREAVSEGIVDASFETDPYAMITWTDAVHVHVLGDITLTTDLPSMPMLSGRGSATWVEHRAPRSTQQCRLWLGVTPNPASDLAAGVVPADGFSLELAVGAPAAAPAAAQLGRPADQQPPAQPSPEPIPDLSGTAAQRGATSGLEALQAATGGDWMEDSLGLPPLVSTVAPGLTSTPDDDAYDPEITLEPLAVAAAVPAAAPDRASDAPPPLAPTNAPRLRTVQARRCPNQHVNAPAAALCRVCREPIVPSEALEVVPQPALGSLILPDGRSVPIDGNLILGRSPTAEVARVTEPNSLWPLDVGNDVSRTHVVVRANGWVLEAVDCGSSGQTVLVSAVAPHAEPTLLEPWVPHELAAGDVLYLGGPTQLRIER